MKNKRNTSPPPSQKQWKSRVQYTFLGSQIKGFMKIRTGRRECRVLVEQIMGALPLVVAVNVVARNPSLKNNYD